MKAARVLAVCAVAVGAGAVVAWQVARPSAPPVRPASTVATATAPISRGVVAARVQLPGVLGYDGDFAVVDYLPAGVLTGVPRLGTTIRRGATLFTVDGKPVRLLYGPRPAHRGFALGMSDGEDVRLLERNLRALGMDPGRAMTVDRRFTWATAAAVRRWQASLHLPLAHRTGRIALGEVAFLPGPTRVRRVRLPAGSLVAPGAQVLSATSATQVVRVSLPTDRRTAVRTGDRVLLTLPGTDRELSGRVREIGDVASAPPDGAGPATVPVRIVFHPPRGLARLDEAPVQVTITTELRRGVLTMPVSALLARPGGGYQVAVVATGGRRLVPVRPGLFDEATSTVEVSGAGLAEGTRVEVPVT
ncbi:peptidoglycan-binding protein [Microbispora sp. H10670]|uniref:peptidoglycan-binding protein n=1 Tax=Microbispora sp. H10670 TaxID=2729108 RepID=UPI001602CE1B|nr:peptidoglycan-binding protein [Microbispora sp. H10670]